jgi:hypothetical protein
VTSSPLGREWRTVANVRGTRWRIDERVGNYS